MEKEFVPQRAMSIHAHPDDQEFSVAGTLAKWAKAGCEIISVVITSGDSGSNDPAKDGKYKSELAALREDEQRAANATLGVKETLRKELTRLIRKYKPEAVVTGNMEGAFYGDDYINHPDHRAAAEAATYAVFPSAGTRLLFADLLEAGYEPHNVKRLYIHGAEKPNTWVDISAEIETKIQALRKHVSQLDENPEKMVREWAVEEGKEKGLAFAEAFKVMILVKDEENG